VKLLQVSFESDFSILHKLKNFLSDAKQIAKYINHFFKEKLRTLYLLSAKKKNVLKNVISLYIELKTSLMTVQQYLMRSFLVG
jgi:hypothetical protein